MRATHYPGFQFVTRLAVVSALIGIMNLCQAQQSALPGFTVIRGSDDPAAITMLTAYERMVRGHLIGNTRRGVDFLAYQVRLGRKSAEQFFTYAHEGWKQVVAMQLVEADAICADREKIRSKTELAARVVAAEENVDALRADILDGAFASLDDRDGNRLRSYLDRSRAEITTNSYDVERSITESADSLGAMISSVCAYVTE